MLTRSRSLVRARSRAALLPLVILAGAAYGETGAVGGSPQSSPSLGDKAAETTAAATGSSAFATIAESFGGYKSDTRPSRDAIMQFSLSTEIREILAPAGKRVRKGEVLMRARDSEVRAAIERQRILANSTLELENTEKQLELAEFRFDRLKASTQFSQSEYEELRINVEAGKIQKEQAKVNLQAQKVALDQLLAQAERYYLEAPFDGIVEDVMVEVGQGVTEQEKILRIVSTEKLWLDAYAGTAETLRLGLQEGSTAWALVDLADKPRLVKGTVLYVSPVADSVSQTRRVRIEIDNPENWPAGTPARVRFTDPGREWDGYLQGEARKTLSSVQPNVSTPPRPIGILPFLNGQTDKGDLDDPRAFVESALRELEPSATRGHRRTEVAMTALETSAAIAYESWLNVQLEQLAPWHHHAFRFVSVHTLFPGAQLND